MNAILKGEEEEDPRFTSIQQPLLTPSASFQSTHHHDDNHNHVLMTTPVTLEIDTPVLADDCRNEEEEEENERAERCWKEGHREQSYICLANNHIVSDNNNDDSQ